MGLLMLGGVSLIYGILGLFGIQSIPTWVQGKSFEKEYKTDSGINFIILGLAWILVFVLSNFVELSSFLMILLAVIAAIPGLLYAVKREKKYQDK